MKANMKSAFAIIAVALMVMVAVVPMVGVFTSDVAAEIVPEETAGKINLEGSVLDKNGTPIATGGYILATWGNGLYSKQVPIEAGAYTLSLDETTIASLVLTVLDDGENVNNEFASVTKTKLTAGTMQVDIQAGFAVVDDLRVSFANEEDIADVFEDSIISFAYKLWVGESEAKAKSTTGSYVLGHDFVKYPVNNAYVAVEITSVAINGASVALTSVKTEILENSDIVLKQNILAVAMGAAGVPDATVTVAGATAISKPATIGQDGTKAFFFYTADEPWGAATVTAQFGTKVKDASVEVDIAGYTATYTPDAAKFYYGSIKMGDIYAYDGQAVAIKSDTTNLGVYAANGYYITDKRPAVTTNITVTLSGFTIATFGGAVPDENGVIEAAAVPAGQTDVVVASDGYQIVTISAVKETTVTLTGANGIFGVQYASNKATFTVNDDGTPVYVKTNSSITVVPNDASTYAYTMSYVDVIVGSSPVNIVFEIADQTIGFKLKDGDGKAIAAGDLASISVFYLLPGTLDFVELEYAEGYNVNDVPGYVNTSEIYAYFVDSTGKYTFAAYDEYTAIKCTFVNKVMTASALEKTYSLTVKDTDGNIIGLDDADVTFTFYNIYINESKYTIYRDVEQPALTKKGMTPDGKFEYMTSSVYMGKTISTTAQVMPTVIVAIEGYIFSADPAVCVDGMVISAVKDSVTAKVVKTDGTTPVTGALVSLMFEDILIDLATTDSTGSFTLECPVEITNDYRIYVDVDIEGVFLEAGYQPIVAAKKITKITAEKDVFAISVTDADGKAFTFEEGYKLKCNNTVVATAAAKASTVYAVMKITDGQLLSFEVVTGGDDPATARTFSTYTASSSDITSGAIGLTSLESTYTVNIQDADGKGIDATAGNLFAVVEKESVVMEILGNAGVIGKFTKSSTGVYTTVLTALDSSFSYYVKYTVGTDANGYIFNDTPVAFSANAATIKSSCVPISFAVQDANGTELDISGVDVGEWQVKEGTAAAIDVSKNLVANKLMFVGESGKTYKNTAAWVVSDSYTIAANTAIKNGAIKATTEKVVFTATDASGKALNLEGMAINAYKDGAAAATPIAAGIDFENGKASVVFVVDKDYKYALTGDVPYTFDIVSGYNFVANESTVKISLASANGVAINNGIVDDAVAYNADGEEIGTYVAASKAIIVDTTKVDYYQIVAPGEFTFGTSKDGKFVANESIITGTVPKVNGAVEQTVDIQFLKSGAIVDVVEADVEGGKYYAIVDLSGQTTSAVAFDSLAAAYYEDGILVSTTPVSASSSSSPIIVTPAPNPVLLGSDLILDHYTATVVGRQIVLAADQTFDVVIGTTQVEGKQLVNKYTFAGWYVNGVMVSDSANFVVPAEGTTAIYADYSVETVEVEAPSPAANNGVDPTVLIIGICAVIIALIAVAYVVITSRKNNN